MHTVRSSDGYLAQSSRWVRFGIGNRTTVESVHIRWPNGDEQTFHDLAANKWYRLTVPEQLLRSDDPYGSLDVVLLHNLILGPILGISDPRTSERLEYVPGTVPLNYVTGRERTGAFFLVHPTRIDQVAAVADRGLVMPPKSTWFLPKITSGLFVRLLQ